MLAFVILVLVVLPLSFAWRVEVRGEAGGLKNHGGGLCGVVVPSAVTVTVPTYATVTGITVTVTWITVTQPTYPTVVSRTVTVTRITVTRPSYPTVTRITVTVPRVTVTMERLKTITVVSARTITVVREALEVSALGVALSVAVVVGFVIIALALYFRPRLRESAGRPPI